MAPRHLSRLLVAGFAFLASPTAAIELTLSSGTGRSIVGEPHAFTATVTGATGAVKLEWKFGEGQEYQVGEAQMSHTFTVPGRYAIDVVATDAGNNETSSAFAQHLAHYPLTSLRPTSSSSIVYDAARTRVYSVNQDNDTVTSIDPDGLSKVAELGVYRRPESLALMPDGKLWVLHRDDYAVAVVNPDQFTVERGFRLPYASQPVAIAVSPGGDAAYVTLNALGKLLKLDPLTGDVLGEAAVGPSPRGLAVSHDGKDVYVTRFISSDAGGEVIKVDSATMTVATRILLQNDTLTEDSDQKARGLPNYLFSVALTPDGRQAWIPGKKDNISRGKQRDGQDLTHDTTVRPLAAVVDTLLNQEIYAKRIDLDDRSMPVHVEFTPFGNFAILTLAGSDRLEVRDVHNPTQVFSAIAEAGTFPLASVLAPSGRLFVQGSLSRNILVYDMSLLLKDYDTSTPPLIGTIATVATEKVLPQVLQGKKIFHNAEDVRMGFEGYIACGGCHFEGIDDGRVYDFSDLGEGFRNTISLLGRKGGQGRLNWTGTLDEVQDFEHQIRDLFSGTGFIADDVLQTGTLHQALGQSKAGLSPELDALTAYVKSLDRVSPSPYRQPDGSLTPEAVAGKLLFEKLGCDFCHGGADFADSERGLLHDVGTITLKSGTHARQPLLGFDTPSLLGVWETPPYLHDGSAPTLRDVLTTRNTSELHGYVSALSEQQLNELVAYLQQIDGEVPSPRLPFEPPLPPPTATGGASGGGGVGGSGSHAAGSVDPGGQHSTAPAATPGSGSGAAACAYRPIRRDERVPARELAGALALLGLTWMPLVRRWCRLRQAPPERL